MYAIKVYPHSVWAPSTMPTYWLIDPAKGLGVSSNPAEAARFDLDAACKMEPTLRVGMAVGTITRFAELWNWEIVGEEALEQAKREYALEPV